jgi:hypothetical protein
MNAPATARPATGPSPQPDERRGPEDHRHERRHPCLQGFPATDALRGPFAQECSPCLVSPAWRQGPGHHRSPRPGDTGALEHARRPRKSVRRRVGEAGRAARQRGLGTREGGHGADAQDRSGVAAEWHVLLPRRGRASLRRSQRPLRRSLPARTSRSDLAALDGTDCYVATLAGSRVEPLSARKLLFGTL